MISGPPGNRQGALEINTPTFHSNQETTMRGILLWLVGIPIPILILLYLFNVL